jgi:RHS repeat-associated protein
MKYASYGSIKRLKSTLGNTAFSNTLPLASSGFVRSKPTLVVRCVPGSALGSRLEPCSFSSTATPPPLELRTADQNITQRKYHDAKGNLIAAEDAAGRITRTYYDLLDRPYLVVRNWSGADLYSPTPPACNRYEGATTNICSETFYDPGSNAIASRDERGFFTRTYYDADNQPAWVVRNLTYQSYEVAAPPPTTAFGNDHDIAFQTVYDAGGRAIAQVDWWVVDGQVASRTTRTYFNALGQAYLTVQNLDPAYPLGNETPPTCNRDQSGAAPPYNICLETRYDPASGLAIASLDPLGRVTRTYFDALDRPYLSVRNLTAQDYSVETPPPASAFGNDQNVAAQTIYDRRGRAMARVEWWLEDSQVISRTMRTHYDSLGRTVSVVSNFAGDLAAGTPPDFDPASPDRNLRADTHYASDGRAIAQVEWSVDATGQAYARTTRLYADALGRAVQVVQNLDPAWGYQNPSPPPCNRDTTGQGSTYNVCSQTVYDELGQATAQIDALGKATIYQYNSLSQLVAVTDPLTRTLQYGYDAAGNRVSSMDANGVAMRFEYDPLGQLAAVVENYRPGFAPDHETNVRTEYSYDALGNRLTIRDGNDHVTTSTYDSLGRLASERDPLDHTWQQRYDVAGRRVAQTNANGATIAYGYDGLDRLASIDYPAPQADVTFAYNALGWRTSMSDGVGGTQWIYDRLGRALSVTDPFFSTVSYAYNPSGGRTALTYPGGGMVSYQYDALERLARVIAPATTVTYTHDVAGRLLSTSLDNGLVSEYDYDDAGQLLGLAHRRGGETLSSFGYSYDPAGNRAQAQEWLLQPAPASPYSTTISYDYDPLYRLTAADYSSGEYFHYSYDPVGNRLSETTPGGVITSTYDVANRLSSVGGTSYTWDDNGNLLGDGVNTYTFDHANRLTGVTNQQSSISYAYNGLGDRIQQTADSVTTNFTLDLVAGLTQVLADGTNTYLYGMGRIAQVGSNGAEYFLGDALSSVRQLTSANGDITLSHAYEPFGEVTGSAGQGITSFGFAGEWATALEGIDLTYLRARWYAPGIGKFTSRDTWRGSSIMPASYNLWLYAYNNPVKLFDPSGLKPTEPEIREGRHVYSCNCGWIDFDHADPRKSEQIFLMLNARPSAPRNMPVTDGVYVITLYMSLLGLQPSVNAVTKTGLGQDLKNAVALGIFMDLEQYIERLQSLYPPSRSSFSEEDLASDLIGFYMNTLGVMSSARVNDESWNWLADTCGFPKDRQEAMEWSVEVFNTYPEFEQVKKWGTPRLVCTPGIGAGCFGSRGWPDVFSTILPQKSSPSGNWWWYRGVRDDGFLAVSNLQGIYFLINP